MSIYNTSQCPCLLAATTPERVRGFLLRHYGKWGIPSIVSNSLSIIPTVISGWRPQHCKERVPEKSATLSFPSCTWSQRKRKASIRCSGSRAAPSQAMMFVLSGPSFSQYNHNNRTNSESQFYMHHSWKASWRGLPEWTHAVIISFQVLLALENRVVYFEVAHRHGRS